MHRAYVLLSGGIDSTTCLAIACRNYSCVVGVSIDYGQRHRKEIDYAKRSCAERGLRHHILDLSALIPQTALTDATRQIPDKPYSELEGVSPTYVPFRNGLMLSTLAAFAAGEYKQNNDTPGNVLWMDEWAIFFGAHAEDAQNWAYPDCTPEFIGGIANAIYIGTYHRIRLHTPLQWLDKAKIIQLGTNLGVDWCNTWSCYVGGDRHCGVCPTCRARREGFKRAGVADPTEYAA